MRKSPVAKFKYLFPLILFLFIAAPANSSIGQAEDTTRTISADTIKKPGKDSLNVKVNASQQPASTDSVLSMHRDRKAEELVRGERLFYGLAYLKGESVNCAACHNTKESDTLNWNPDALVISIKYLNKNARDLYRVLQKPVGQKMALVHKDFHLTAEDVVLIKGYMDKFTVIGLKPDKPVITNLILFIIASIFFFFQLQIL